MSHYLIRDIVRAMDIKQAVGVDMLAVSHELPAPLKRNRQATYSRRCISNARGPVDRLAVGRQAKTANTLLALFASLVTQLRSLISGEQDEPRPVNPHRVKRELAPPFSPTLEPDTLAFKPNAEADISGLSSKRGGAKPDDIWGGFRQGPDGNCVTVSAIKAAMYRFGQSPTDIYQQVTKFNDGYLVQMRDGFKVLLTDKELAYGARNARFKGRDEGMVKDAQFLFAVSAKRAQMENNDGFAARSYQAAIRSLNDGEDELGPGEAFLRLGLRKHMRTVSVHELARGQLGMCNRRGHSVAVINGREEIWGRKGSAPYWGDAIALV